MKAHKVTGGGIQLHVEETGNPGGRPLHLIHGFSQCRLARGENAGRLYGFVRG